MLTADQRVEFDRTGLLRLPGAAPLADAEAMADRVWTFLADHAGVDRSDPATWPTTRPTGFQPVSRAGGLDPMWSAAVCAALEDLIGTDTLRREGPRVLMTFPDTTQEWAVPHAGWHFDYIPPHPRVGLRAVQVFLLLQDVLPGGGGTVVLEGSHRLVDDYVSTTALAPRPKLVRRHFSAIEPWLADLWTAGSDDGRAGDREPQLGSGAVVSGVPLRIAEVTGFAGDVYLMHSDCFHAVAPNSGRVPRMMVTSVVSRLPSAGQPSAERPCQTARVRS
jgi:hypothetical protein